MQRDQTPPPHRHRHHPAKVAAASSDTEQQREKEEQEEVQVEVEMAEEEEAEEEQEADRADMATWTEADFEERCTYIVKDTAWEAGPDDDHAPSRAEASLPRNLVFKRQVDSEQVRVSHTDTHKK